MAFEIPDALGPMILAQFAKEQPDVEVGFVLIAVTHGKPLATMTNLPDDQQLYLLGIAATAITEESLTVSTLLNPEGSA